MKAVVVHKYGGPEVLKFEDYPDPVPGPLVTLTGNQLLSATGVKAGQTVLVAGAAGNVGRSAVFAARERGATVIAGVLKRQMDEARTAGADQVIATDDDTPIANLPPLDAVADTVDGKTAEKLIARVKPGGVFATVLTAPQNAVKYPAVKVAPVSEIRQENARVHGRRRARRQAGDPD